MASQLQDAVRPHVLIQPAHEICVGCGYSVPRSVSVSTGPNANKDSALEVVVSSQCPSLTIPLTDIKPLSPTKTKSKKSRHVLLKCSALILYNLKHKALERGKIGGTSPKAKKCKQTTSSGVVSSTCIDGAAAITTANDSDNEHPEAEEGQRRHQRVSNSPFVSLAPDSTRCQHCSAQRCSR
ncbi:hypothetical protein FA15DRAFT_709229 [Coprinopsis marcescibilis]|uniref:Uncharacterized protein n=1 Tax=Coprinopsis marcescibilis TaxID=230819 RepID=A0A5C3KGE6_COPMA|nr:hypothetical protein FA15DRAFT_709229 [Coprinopsis marcescibilis]